MLLGLNAQGGIGRQETVKLACRERAAEAPDPNIVATPLKELMGYTQAEYYERGGVHYAQGWALVHMLRESKDLQRKWELILDDYVLTPAIQGESTDLMTPMILFASIGGGVLLGFYGLLVAIPLAACVKILWMEIFWPRITAWSEGRAKDPLPLDSGG